MMFGGTSWLGYNFSGLAVTMKGGGICTGKNLSGLQYRKSLVNIINHVKMVDGSAQHRFVLLLQLPETVMINE